MHSKNIRNDMPPAMPVKKEIRLAKMDLLMMFGFVLALGVLSFTLGVRLGKKQALSEYGEEYLAKQVAETSRIELVKKINTPISVESLSVDPAKEPVVMEPMTAGIDMSSETKPEVGAVIKPKLKKIIADETSFVGNGIEFIVNNKTEYAGKFTIVVGEFLDTEDATFFAEAFHERGYKPFIKKVNADGLDKVRVSLGAYASETEAKTFIKSREDIFIKNKYIISKL